MLAHIHRTLGVLDCNVCVCLGGQLLLVLLWVGSDAGAWKAEGCVCLLSEGRKLIDVVSGMASLQFY